MIAAAGGRQARAVREAARDRHRGRAAHGRRLRTGRRGAAGRLQPALLGAGADRQGADRFRLHRQGARLPLGLFRALGRLPGGHALSLRPRPVRRRHHHRSDDPPHRSRRAICSATSRRSAPSSAHSVVPDAVDDNVWLLARFASRRARLPVVRPLFAGDRRRHRHLRLGGHDPHRDRDDQPVPRHAARRLYGASRRRTCRTCCARRTIPTPGGRASRAAGSPSSRRAAIPTTRSSPPSSTASATGKPPAISGLDGLRAQEVVQAAYLSVRDRRLDRPAAARGRAVRRAVLSIGVRRESMHAGFHSVGLAGRSLLDAIDKVADAGYATIELNAETLPWAQPHVTPATSGGRARGHTRRDEAPRASASARSAHISRWSRRMRRRGARPWTSSRAAPIWRSRSARPSSTSCRARRRREYRRSLAWRWFADAVAETAAYAGERGVRLGIEAIAGHALPRDRRFPPPRRRPAGHAACS